jgi:hypothetical protein
MSPDYNEDDDDPEPIPYADLGDPQTMNLYTYAENNPVSYFDDDGHQVAPAQICTPTWLCAITHFFERLFHGGGGNSSNNGDTGPRVRPPSDPNFNPVLKPRPLPPYTYKQGGPYPPIPLPPNTPGGQLLNCTSQCFGKPFVVTSTNEPAPAHKPVPPATTDPHMSQDAFDARVPGSEVDEFLQCASNCGATWGSNEYKHLSKKGTAGHVHVERDRHKRTRGDLPPAKDQ